jgi:hypothetical protein
VKAGIGALGLLLLTGAAPGAKGEQPSPVRVSVAEREGAGTTVCLAAAPAVRGRKRAQVSHGGGHAVLSVSPESPGPHCAELAQPSGTVQVSLHFSRAWVIPSTLGEHSYPADDVRGKRITFLWLRD